MDVPACETQVNIVSADVEKCEKWLDAVHKRNVASHMQAKAAMELDAANRALDYASSAEREAWAKVEALRMP